MSVNKYRPHVYVLPEDDANHAIANGFQLDDGLNTRSMQVLPSAGGWTQVRDAFSRIHRYEMARIPNRHMVLLVDFDQMEDRREQLRSVVPAEMEERVFVLGVWSEPEALPRAGLGTPEEVGRRLAKECRERSSTTWDHPLLQHNATERTRMEAVLRSILFPSA